MINWLKLYLEAKNLFETRMRQKRTVMRQKYKSQKKFVSAKKKDLLTVAYLETSRTTTMELFCENS